ncbi:two component transcriptional regulator, LuxR family [Dehalogenimonas lykanthroporepellens BL-DC-9]|jgi:DNA-binding NarL/FixJ family response regulator|nr:two component transcriptional regulator, LuxR family [Dehalogenimonas lykanthroporepellens BL-DC-9]
MSRIRVFIVDDNFVARRGLRSYLELEQDILVVGEAAGGRDAVEWVKNNPVDIVLMDVHMPGFDGIKAAAGILKIRPGIKALMLTVVEDQTTILRALLAGASGYLIYGQFAPEDMVGAIRAVASGDTSVTPQIDRSLLEQIQQSDQQFQNIAEMESAEPLTAREIEILTLIAAGKGNREIAETLFIEEKTVKNHINVIYSKLRIKSRYEAISYMLRQNTNV